MLANIRASEHNRIKQILSAELVLGLFDPRKKITIKADVSSVRLGAGLLHEGQPIAYASRMLPSEQNWFQIDNELLAIVFGAIHLWGDVEVECDRKPLKVILKKLNDALFDAI